MVPLVPEIILKPVKLLSAAGLFDVCTEVAAIPGVLKLSKL